MSQQKDTTERATYRSNKVPSYSPQRMKNQRPTDSLLDADFPPSDFPPSLYPHFFSKTRSAPSPVSDVSYLPPARVYRRSFLQDKNGVVVLKSRDVLRWETSTLVAACVASSPKAPETLEAIMVCAIRRSQGAVWVQTLSVSHIPLEWIKRYKYPKSTRSTDAVQ